MDFKHIYRHEVYLSRKDRSRRAFFMAKITGIALALTIGATLRAAPDLRSALMTAGMDGVATLARLERPAPQHTAAALSGPSAQPAPSTLPPSRVKINRPAAQAPSTTYVPSTTEAPSAAPELSGLRAQMAPNG